MRVIIKKGASEKFLERYSKKSKDIPNSVLRLANQMKELVGQILLVDEKSSVASGKENILKVLFPEEYKIKFSRDGMIILKEYVDIIDDNN